MGGFLKSQMVIHGSDHGSEHSIITDYIHLLIFIYSLSL